MATASSAAAAAAAASALARFSQSLVACNVYVSAGGAKPSHAKILLKLLQDTQQHCARLYHEHEASSSASSSMQSSSLPLSSSSALVVHAYSDRVYNRSSFHLAGSAGSVRDVAARLATNALEALLLAEQQEQQAPTKSSGHNDDKAIVDHPHVGLVDHVAVMPLVGTDKDNESSNNSEANDDGAFHPWTSSGWAARLIGQAMKDKLGNGIQVFYYGTAHPQGTPLAIVRREQTQFFQSGGLLSEQQQQQKNNANTKSQVATVGAPLGFVENYNIRLLSNQEVISKAMAQSLTRHVRERDGSGLAGVEALTLPYSQGRYEVACNLLRPDVASADDIQAAVDQWEEAIQQQQRQKQQQPGMALVEKGYRVGTTAEQCLEALSLTSKDERTKHDEQVLQQFQSYLLL